MSILGVISEYRIESVGIIGDIERVDKKLEIKVWWDLLSLD